VLTDTANLIYKFVTYGKVVTMAKYQYLAKDRQGRTVEGIMHVSDEDELYRRLKEEDKFLVEASETMKEQSTRQLPALMLSEFNRELGDMLSAGVTLVRALGILSQEETRKAKERAAIARVLKLVRQGQAVSDAMEQQKGAFPLLMVNMYRAAESSGKLADTAKRLAVHYEKEHQLNTKVKGATVYPKILSVLLIAVVVFIMSFILPRLSDLFENLTTLPLPTRILFGISSFVENYWQGLIIAVFAVAVFVGILGNMPAVQLWRDYIKLRIPVTGKLFMIIYTARFARSLSSLYSAGIPIISAMQIARRTIGNRYVEKQFDDAISGLRAGKALSEVLDGIYGFRKKLAAVVRVGEESGNLVQMLDSMADSFDYESEMAVGRLVSYMEPILIVFMALIIGFIMIAVMLPIYESYTAIGSSTYY